MQMARAERIIFMGTPDFAVPSLEALIEAGHEIVLVVTQPDKPGGRGLSSRPSAVKEAAIRHGLEVFEPPKLRDEGVVQRLKGLKPDFIAVVAYGKILPESILDIPPKGCINLHASLLPKYRGAAPINRAIINGEKETGVSTMYMDRGMDTGPVLLEEKTAISAMDTALELSMKLSVSGAKLLARTVGLLREGRLQPAAQDERLASYAPVLKKEDGRIDWTKDAEAVKNLIRGVYPWPGAYTAWGGKVLKIHSGKARMDTEADGPPGAVVDVSEGKIIVACGRGVFEIAELQPESKKRMAAGDFLKGYRLKKGDRFD